jgi:hypothetical protein
LLDVPDDEELTFCQADQKTTPTNPMRELRIDKLVISWVLLKPLLDIVTDCSQQTSPSVNPVIVSLVPQKSWNNSPVKPRSPQKLVTPSEHSVFVVTKRSLSMSPSVDPRLRRSWSVD